MQYLVQSIFDPAMGRTACANRFKLRGHAKDIGSYLCGYFANVIDLYDTANEGQSSLISIPFT